MLTLPNWITLSRLLVIPVILGILSSAYPWARPVALAAFLIGAATDWLDGYVARSLNQTSDLGKWLDPLVDKLLTIAPLLILVELGELPAWAVFLLIARELVITAWRNDQVQIQGANLWGKLKTVSQIIAIAALLIQLPYAIWLFGLALVLTLISGILYVLPDQL
ncbi:MAG: CDP-diacylglycerol--glycerol-3-phosphate 3-phosphatidyltransferase [Pseudanabaenaceae cyanobacterium bins.68]|nr:CDP-diacylglycerol--glycerol-3-phosphate 3-phosphatidyltransferase [Pseudanabaenaceae cyanobacterium bins.68]